MNDKIIQGNFGPKRPIEPGPYAKPQAGNPNPGDPRQPSPPVLQEDQALANRVLGTDPAKVPPDERSGHFIRKPNGEVMELNEAQIKAIGCIMEGIPFVFIGIRPTATGADFLRALNGSDADLRNAYDHLVDQIDKAYYKRGLLT